MYRHEAYIKKHRNLQYLKTQSAKHKETDEAKKSAEEKQIQKLQKQWRCILPLKDRVSHWSRKEARSFRTAKGEGLSTDTSSNDSSTHNSPSLLFFLIYKKRLN